MPRAVPHVFAACSLLLLLSACQPAQGKCDARLRQLQSKLDRFEDTPINLFGDAAQRVSVAARSRDVRELGALLEISQGELRLDGRRQGLVGSKDAFERLLSELDVLHRNWGILHPETKHHIEPLYIAADSGVTAGTLLELMRALPASNEARLVVRRRAVRWPGPLPRGASPTLQRKVVAVRRAQSHEEQANLLAELAAQGSGSNEALQILFRHMASENVWTTSEILRTGVVPALRVTRCRDVDLDALEASIVLLLTPNGPATGWLPLRVHSSLNASVAEVVSLSADATISQVVEALSHAEALEREVELQVVD